MRRARTSGQDREAEQELVGELARAVVRCVAPEELGLFAETEADYFRDPGLVLRARSRDEAVGFGLDLALLTPYVLAVGTAVVHFLALVVSDAVRDEARDELKPVIAGRVRRLLRRDDPDAADRRQPTANDWAAGSRSPRDNALRHGLVGFRRGVHQSGEHRVMAQLIQATSPAGPDAPDRDAQPGADLGVRHGWILGEHFDQLPAFWWQARQGLAQRGVALRHQQLMFGHPGLLVWDVLGVQHQPERLWSSRCAQDPDAFPVGGSGQPASQCSRITNRFEPVHQPHPDALTGIGGVIGAEPVPAAD